MSDVRWVLCGFGPFAFRVLEASISEGWAPVAVFAMDAASDLEPRSMQELAATEPVPVLTSNPNDGGFLELSALQPDVLFAVNYPRLLSERVLSTAQHAFNIHDSLLPTLRGRAPLTWALIEGHREIGATVHVMESTVDTGPIVAQRAVEVAPSDTVATIQEQLLSMYPIMVRQTLDLIQEGRLVTTPQTGTPTYGSRRTPEDGRIDWTWTSQRIFNWVRALTRPYPGAFTVVEGGTVRVWSVSTMDRPSGKPPGTVLCRSLTVGIGEGWAVACGDGMVILLDHDDPDNVLAEGAVLL